MLAIFGSSIRALGFEGSIISFEPLPDAHILLQKAAASDALWTVAERMAIGDSEGDVTINVSKNSVSSSFLEMENLHLDTNPESKFIKKEVFFIFLKIFEFIK